MNILQIGVCDGVDHVFSFCEENQHSLKKVILVEPVPAAMIKVREQYKDIPNCRFVEAAAVYLEDSNAVDIYVPTNEEVSGHSSLIKGHVFRHLHPEIKAITVNALHVNSILEKFNEEVIDRVYIDVEGLDVELISVIDFNRFKIPFLQFEAAHSDGTHKRGPKLRELLSYLEGLGYCCSPEGEYDYTAIKPI